MKRLAIIVATLACAVPAWGAGRDASLLSGPVPAAPIGQWLADRDDPGRTSWTGKDGPMRFALSVSARGNVIECLVERSSGSTDLDETLCRRLRQRGEFRPASDAAGQAVLGVYRGNSTGSAAVDPVDMAIGLQFMPQGMADPAQVEIAVAVDQSGRVRACQPADGQGAAAKLLGGTACAEAVKALRLNPARTVQGRAGASTQAARVLFTADSQTFASAVTGPAEPSSPATLARPAPSGEPGEIVVTGSQIVGRREAVIPFRGFSPIKDFEPIGYELVLLQANGGKWYRAKLMAPCIGNESMMPRGGRRQPAMAFVTHADGTFDRFSEVYVRGMPPPFPNGRCEIESLVESAPPKLVKAQMKADRAARTAEAKAR